MLKETKALVTGHDMQPTLPLIRLRIEVTEDCQMFHPIQFGQDYGDLVANPLEMIIFSRKFQQSKHDFELDKGLIEDAFDQKQSGEESNKVEDVIQKYFENASGKHQLKILSISALQEMIHCMVKAEGKDDDKRKEIIDYYIDHSIDSLGLATRDEIFDKLAEFRLNEKTTFDNLLKNVDKKIKKHDAMEDIASTSVGQGRGSRKTVSNSSAVAAVSDKRAKLAPKKIVEKPVASRSRNQTKKVVYIESDSD